MTTRRAEPHSAAPTLMDRLDELHRRKRLRMTGQRRTIAEVLAESEDHPSVDEIFRRAVARDTKVSMATVYRTIRLLEDARILDRHDFGDGRARYEQSPSEHHDHLVDMTTGKVIEFQDEEIEALQERIASRLGFRLVGHRLELFGVPLKTPESPRRR